MVPCAVGQLTPVTVKSISVRLWIILFNLCVCGVRNQTWGLTHSHQFFFFFKTFHVVWAGLELTLILHLQSAGMRGKGSHASFTQRGWRNSMLALQIERLLQPPHWLSAGKRRRHKFTDKGTERDPSKTVREPAEDHTGMYTQDWTPFFSVKLHL